MVNNLQRELQPSEGERWLQLNLWIGSDELGIRQDGKIQNRAVPAQFIVEERVHRQHPEQREQFKRQLALLGSENPDRYRNFARTSA